MLAKNNICIIAEAGVNHNGDLRLALQLVDAAAEAGADMVKFQTFRASELTNASASKAGYQLKTTEAEESQQDMLKKLELRAEDFAELASHAQKKGISFLSTPFDRPSIELLASMGMSIWKIPSGEITNLPYLRHVAARAAQGGQIILSSGMCYLYEVGEALHALELAGMPQERITLLHCTTEYPAPLEDVNLKAMHTLKAAFPRCAGVGYSDHTAGIAVSLAAAALGATVIEKHFTLDRNMEGPDHKASLEPDELVKMVQAIRDIETALGNHEKAPSTAEIPNITVARKSIVAARDITEGEVFTEENITTKRPGSGMSPMLWDTVLGQRARRGYRQDEML